VGVRDLISRAFGPPANVRAHLADQVERRDPTQATRTVSYSTPGFPMYPEWDGRQGITRGFYQSVYVNRALSILAHDLAKLALRAGAQPPENLWDQPDHNPNAPLARLLGPAPFGPNPATSSRAIWRWTVIQYLAAGRWAWEAELATGRGSLSNRQIVGLWPIPVQYINPIPTPGGTSYFKSFEYNPNGTPRTIPAERMVYCWRPSQDDWRQPESVLKAASLSVTISTLIDRYHHGLLENRNVPDTLVITPGFIDHDERKAFRDQFTAEYGGARNAGKTLFAEAEPGDDGKVPPVQVERLAMTTKDAMLLELRNAALNDVSIATGVPKSKLGDAAGRTFDNAAQEDANYQLDTLAPLALELADHLNLALAPRLGSEVGWFDLSQLPAVRELGGVVGPVAPAGDTSQPTAADEPAPAQDPPALAVAASAPEPEKRDAALRPLIIQRAPDPAPVDHGARRAALWRAADQHTRTLEHLWERQLREYFAAQERAVLAGLERRRHGNRKTETRAPDLARIFDVRT
jgi:hypothetical protein